MNFNAKKCSLAWKNKVSDAMHDQLYMFCASAIKFLEGLVPYFGAQAVSTCHLSGWISYVLENCIL